MTFRRSPRRVRAVPCRHVSALLPHWSGRGCVHRWLKDAQLRLRQAVERSGPIVADGDRTPGGTEVHMAIVTLIVMEPGSEWPGHVGDSEEVIALGNHETAAGTIGPRVDSLRRRGQVVRVAVMACSESEGSPSVTRRSELAHELLAAVVGTGFRRLVLTASDAVSLSTRCELLSLAGALTQRLSGTKTTVSVRFGANEARDVGVRAPSRGFAGALRQTNYADAE
jgi:hypothetical protein